MNDQWYTNRDRRTDSCDGVSTSYKNAIVEITVHENTEEYRVQLIIYLTLKILVKWCRNIRLNMTDNACLLSNESGNLASFLRTEVLAADPFCTFDVNTETGQKNAGITLYIGRSGTDPAEDFISVNAMGWVAACGFNQQVVVTNKKSDCFIGPAFAACLANAELFRYLIGEKPFPYSKWYSLWLNEVSDQIPSDLAFGTEMPAIDFGRIHLIGCGAIGSSFAFLFPYSGCSAQFLLVDPDKVQDHNTSSSLLFNYGDSVNEEIKVGLCKDYLEKKGLYAKPFRDDYKSFEYDHEMSDLRSADVILCFANENNIWSTIQYLYPPLCFHATTSKSWGIHIGRHIPLVDDCIMCTFEELVKVNYTPVCAAAEIPGEAEDKPKETHTAILPFLAPAAALVTLSELFKTVTDIEKKESTVIFNMQSSEGIFVSQHGKFGECYICKTQTGRLYTQFCGHTKFWKYSH